MATADLDYRGGRTPKLNPDRAQRFCEAISIGLPRVTASARAGVTASATEKYVKRGRRAIAALEDTVDRLDHEAWALLESMDDTPPATPARAGQWPPMSERDEALLLLVPELDRIYVRFVREVEKAWAAFEARNVALIQEAAQGYEVEEVTEEWGADGNLIRRTVRTKTERSWQAAMTLLERRMPDRYSQLRRHEITGSGGGPLEVDAAVAHIPVDVAARDAQTLAMLEVLAAIPGALSANGHVVEDAEVVEDTDGDQPH